MANWLLEWSSKADASGLLLNWRALQGAPVRSPLAPGVVWLGDLRLDNLRALRDRWGLAHDASAATLVLHAYQVLVHQGRSPLEAACELAESLVGDFSFALVDEVRRGVVLVRDALAVRPLYFCHGPADSGGHGCGCGLAGDTWSGMLDRLAEVSTSRSAIMGKTVLALSDAVMGAWCVNGAVHDERHTFVDGVHKLPRASVAWMSTDSDGEPVRYWDVSQITPLLLKSETEYVAALRALLDQAVVDRMAAAEGFSGSVAAHCSGGMDSTAIAIRAARVARHAGQTEFRTYNWCEPAGEDVPRAEAEAGRHEWEDARRVAREEGFLHREVGLSVNEIVMALTTHDLVREGTTPFLCGYEAHVLRDAAAGGVGTLFSGFGGDEILTERGREWHVPALRQGQWGEVWQDLRVESTPGWGLERWKLPLRFGRELWRAARKTNALGDVALVDARRESVASVLQAERIERIDALSFAVMPPLPLHDRQRWRMASGYHQERLENWALQGDRAGVRYVYPQLDRRVVEFALAVPAQWYFRQGESRYLYRRAVADVVPDWLLSKRKPPEMLRVMQYLRMLRQALSQPIVQDWIAESDSAYVDTAKLLTACRALGSLDMTHLVTARAQLKAMSSAVLALTTERAMAERQHANRHAARSLASETPKAA